MLLVGLTGSIGMGKSETAKMFAKLGVPVYDADAAVHALYDKGGAAVGPVGDAFPGVVVDGAIDREKLSKKVLHHPDEIKRLEKIVHPLVGEAQINFLKEAVESGAPMAVLDIPLLYETGGEARVDVVVVVSAPEHIQRTRVLDRPGMTEEKLEAILGKQVHDTVKREKADYIVETDKGLEHAFEQVKRIIDDLKGREGKVLAGRLGKA